MLQVSVCCFEEVDKSWLTMQLDSEFKYWCTYLLFFTSSCVFFVDKKMLKFFMLVCLHCEFVLYKKPTHHITFYANICVDFLLILVKNMHEQHLFQKQPKALFLAHLSTKCSVSFCDPSMSVVRPCVACVRPSVRQRFL